MARKPMTDDAKARARENLAKARALRGARPKPADKNLEVVVSQAKEIERLKSLLGGDAQMEVLKEELPETPRRFLDDEEWHYYLCIKSKADEEDEEAEKCSRDPDKGGYSLATEGRISARKVWLRIPQALFKSRKQAAVDEAARRRQRPAGSVSQDGDLVQRHDRAPGQYAGV